MRPFSLSCAKIKRRAKLFARLEARLTSAPWTSLLVFDLRGLGRRISKHFFEREDWDLCELLRWHLFLRVYRQNIMEARNGLCPTSLRNWSAKVTRSRSSLVGTR